MSRPLKRSNAPIFWGLFGAGGMLAALLGPMLVFITGIAAPLGFILAPDAMSYANMMAFTGHWLGKAFVFAIVPLFLWHAGHRVFHSLHDVGIHAGMVARLVCYGGALLGTLIVAWALLLIGF
ncbi:fumarate reductase subunit FrdD [Azoarcus sp. L1K30]|uniref:fumarate reductase subunit FrdD n=1 Tax=Azoarcus sp. L1K30 TaxID=2820277 RepID=UPI0020129152|nr:fumarate reductase subunit FrdD [Azoarcus sp. L1K30]